MRATFLRSDFYHSSFIFSVDGNRESSLSSESCDTPPIRTPVISNASKAMDVHITQPCSLPASPIAATRPIPNTAVSPLVQCSDSPSQLCMTHQSHQVKTSYLSEAASKSAKPKNSCDNMVTSWGAGSTQNDNWQAMRPTLRERNALMCNNELMADLYFVVSNNGEKSVRFPVHKYVLAIGSSVFYAMFYGSLAETGDEVVVPDVEPEAFSKMLR